MLTNTKNAIYLTFPWTKATRKTSTSFIVSTLQIKNLLEKIKIKNVGKYKNCCIFDIPMKKRNSENFHIDSASHSVRKVLFSSDVVWKMISDEAIAFWPMPITSTWK